ncbi:hypothetical protein ACVHNB_32625 [Streptomyces sp. YJ-C3]
MSPETARELEALRARVAELEALLTACRAVHVKHSDSEHCEHDGEPWPCPTLAALSAPAEVSADRLTALLAPTQALARGEEVPRRVREMRALVDRQRDQAGDASC